MCEGVGRPLCLASLGLGLGVWCSQEVELKPAAIAEPGMLVPEAALLW